MISRLAHLLKHRHGPVEPLGEKLRKLDRWVREADYQRRIAQQFGLWYRACLWRDRIEAWEERRDELVFGLEDPE